VCCFAKLARFALVPAQPALPYHCIAATLAGDAGFKDIVKPSDKSIRTQFQIARQSSGWPMPLPHEPRYDAAAAIQPLHCLVRAESTRVEESE
jgi:hypothetical protein